MLCWLLGHKYAGHHVPAWDGALGPATICYAFAFTRFECSRCGKIRHPARGGYAWKLTGKQKEFFGARAGGK